VWRKVASQLRMIDEASTVVSEKCAVLTPRRMQQHVCRSSIGRQAGRQADRTRTNDLVLCCTPYHCLHARNATLSDPCHHEPHSCHSTAHYTHDIIANVKKKQAQLISFGRHGSCRTGNVMLVVSSNIASSACQ
jgi:hypothetical protein